MLNTTMGYVVILSFGLLMFLTAIFMNRRSKGNLDDFFSARESMTLPIAMSSLVVTWIWSSSLMGAAEGSYEFGVAGFYMYTISVLISAVFLGWPVLKRVREIAPDISTFPEYMRIRLGTNVHIVFGIVAILQMFFWGVLQITAIGIVMNVLFGMPHGTAVLIAGLIVTAYIGIGGLRGSIGTDVVQFIMLCALLLVVIPMTVWAAGGPSTIYQGLSESPVETATLLYTEESITGWLLVSVMSFINYAVINQNVWQRVYAAKRGTETKLILGSTFLWIPIPALAALVGMIGLAIGLQVTPSEVLPAAIGEVLGPWGAYAIAVIMIATILSTADSCLNSMSTLVMKDVYIPYVNKNVHIDSARAMRFSRYVVIVGGLLMTVFSMGQFSILYLNYAVGALTLAVTWPFVLSVFMKSLNRTAALWGVIIGTATAFYFAVLPGADVIDTGVDLWIGYVISHVVSAAIPIIGSLLKPDREFRFDQL